MTQAFFFAESGLFFSGKWNVTFYQEIDKGNIKKRKKAAYKARNKKYITA